MKSIKDSPLRYIAETARLFARPEFAFIAAILGVIAQLMHVFWLSDSISQFEGFARNFSSSVIATVLSISLLYFTLLASKLQKDNTTVLPWYKRIFNKVNFFWFFEILTNVFYYMIANLMEGGEFKEVITTGDKFMFVIASIFSSMIPTVIKFMASSMNIFSPQDNEVIIDRNLYTEFKEYAEKLIVDKVGKAGLSLDAVIEKINEQLKPVNDGLDRRVLDMKTDLRADINKMFNELQVRYKELEKQNDILRSTQENELKELRKELTKDFDEKLSGKLSTNKDYPVTIWKSDGEGWETSMLFSDTKPDNEPKK